MARVVRKHGKAAARKKVSLAPIPAAFKYKALALAVTIAVAAAIATVAFVFWFYDVQVNKYDMHVFVAANAGFNVATDAVWFGKVPPTAIATRSLALHNNKAEARLASLYLFGDLASWVSVGQGSSRVLLASGESRNVDLALAVPEDAHAGPVDGWVVVVFRKP